MTVYSDTLATYGYTVPKQKSLSLPKGAALIGRYFSGDIAERYSSIPLGKYVCALQVLVPDPRPGDVILADADGEVTSDRACQTVVDSQLIWAGSNGAILSGALAIFSENNGMNVDADMHHLKITNDGSIVVPSDTPSGALRYVSWVWHCASSNTTALPKYVKIEPGCSTISVLHFRPVS